VLELKGCPGRWHLHLHALITGSYLPKRDLSRLWAQVSPGKIIRIRAVPPGDAVRYITKYVTKTDLPEAFQLEASTTLKGVRMFNAFGALAPLIRAAKLPPAVCPNCGNECWIWIDNPIYQALLEPFVGYYPASHSPPPLPPLPQPYPSAPTSIPTRGL
jgi:hypothetical protein